MRRLVIAGLVFALHAAPAAQTPAASRPMQADAVVRLLADLEAALAAGRSDLSGIAAESLPDESRRVLSAAVASGPPSSVAVRERARRPSDTGVEVLAEVFVARGRSGRIATWRIDTRARPDAPDRAELTGLTELAALDNLLKLSLDTTRQFAVHDLVLSAPDVTLRMQTGSAFLAEGDGGTTAVVLRGKGDLRFAPGVAAEQAQLRQFGGKPALTTAIDTAFVRVNPAQFVLQVTDKHLQPMTVDPNEAARATDVFTQMAPLSYNLDLRDLSRDRWSLEPSFGSAVIEFRSRRFGWLTYARSPSEQEDVSLFERNRRRNLSIYASPEKLAERGEFYSDNDRAAYATDHYALDLHIDPARAWIAGRTTMQVRILQPTGSLTLKLAEPFAVASVTSAEYGRLLSLRIIGQHSIIVSLPKLLLPGTLMTLEIEYNGRLEPQAVNREAAAPTGDQDTNQTLPVLPEVVLVPEPRFVYSNSVYWYPQAPAADYATATMRLTVPSEYQLIASGTVVAAGLAPIEATGGDNVPRYARTVEYRADRPVRYLSCAISRFVPVGRTRADVPAVAPVPSGSALASELTPLLSAGPPGVNIEVVATPRQASRNRSLPARVADVMQFYARTIGEAPYPDFTLAAIDDNLPGGHSPPYFALVQQPLPTSPYSWGSDPVAFDGFPNFFVAHEVAHQWWGQAVGWKNYHEQWLSEGLAQYFAVLYAESDRGPAAAESVLSQMRSSAAAVADQGPIYLGYRLGQVIDDTRIYRAIAYNKSAVVMHMLRRLVGDDAFMRAMRRFYTTWKFKKAGTDDLRAAFEAETDLPLGRFFRRWIMDAAIPRVRVVTREEPGAVVVRIEQIGVDVFDFPYTVTLQYQDGSREAVTIPVSTAVTERRLPLAGPLRRVDTKDELTLVNLVR